MILTKNIPILYRSYGWSVGSETPVNPLTWAPLTLVFVHSIRPFTPLNPFLVLLDFFSTPPLVTHPQGLLHWIYCRDARQINESRVLTRSIWSLDDDLLSDTCALTLVEVRTDHVHSKCVTSTGTIRLGFYTVHHGKEKVSTQNSRSARTHSVFCTFTFCLDLKTLFSHR